MTVGCRDYEGVGGDCDGEGVCVLPEPVFGDVPEVVGLRQRLMARPAQEVHARVESLTGTWEAAMAQAQAEEEGERREAGSPA